ncbi:hypothetical protein ACUWFG_33580, partial [Escherichia coli]
MRYGASIPLTEISQHAASLKIQNISRYWGLTVRNDYPQLIKGLKNITLLFNTTHQVFSSL